MSNQTTAGSGIYSICNDPNQTLIYADLQLTHNGSTNSTGPPVPPVKPIKPTNVNQHHSQHQYHSSMMMYQPLGSARTIHYSHSSAANNRHHHHSSSSNSSTPPSLSTSSTNSNHYNHNNNSNTNLHNSSNNSTSNTMSANTAKASHNSTLNPSQFLHHTYDRPDAIKHAQSYIQRVNSSFAAKNDEHNRITSLLANRGTVYHTNGEGGGHCEYAILRFDHPPSPPSQCWFDLHQNSFY